jgi:phosphohistidine phosphatase
MRHGKSAWDKDVDDRDRGLTKRGKRDAVRVGKAMCALGVVPDTILSSSAKRARSTARRVARACGYRAEVVLIEECLYLSGVQAHLQRLHELPDDVRTVLIVGHNPLLEQVAELLTGRAVGLSTASVVCIDLPIAIWSGLAAGTVGNLRWILRPDACGPEGAQQPSQPSGEPAPGGHAG